MGQVFNKGLDAGEKQVGLLKRLKNIEYKTDRQLEENKEKQLKDRHKKQNMYMKNFLTKKNLLMIKNLTLEGVTILIMILVILVL